MKCIYCEMEIPENSKFCMGCGKPIVQEEIACKNCGQALPFNAKFCNNCGANVNGTTAVSDNTDNSNVDNDNIDNSNTDNRIKIVIERKKQMMGSQPADIYIDDEFLGTLRCGDFINYNLDTRKAESGIKIRIVLLYLFNKSRSLYMTVKTNETNSKSITVIQNPNNNAPEADITGFDVISRTLSGVEKYSSPRI